ncbi:E3 ubiquitin-protein ligase RSL1-like [Trifolium pratense]|uniref:E3 ubiquitin-protein ligase RSL1-like n=1 Tax=Trifolium pratense TaxID=57577 RepID=UPI001E696B65|nr:E3 ubiquitin-protein ligase RSL1-like [Trifolium pratense]
MGQEKRTRTRRRNRVPRIDSGCFFPKRKISDSLFDFSDEENDYVNILIHSLSRKPKRNNNFEKGESSNAKDRLFYCKICMDTKKLRDAFCLSGCNHVYCSDCVAIYIRYKLDDKIINIRCPFPECRGSLEPEFCRSILPTDDFKRWNKAVCEVLFNITEKFYCPFADCSALLINDGTEAVRNLECPNCNRMLCGQCKVRWHEGIECSEVKKLKRGDKGKDIMLTNIAKDMKWRQCPKCRLYVARSESCNIMKCRFYSS